MALGELPEALRTTAAHVTCVAGATPIEDLRAMLGAAGFGEVRIEVRAESAAFISQWLPGSGAEAHVASATIEAVRPAAPRAGKPRVTLGVAPSCEPGSGCC